MNRLIKKNTEIEAQIKDYLWFHLSAENKKAFIKYFKHNDHFKTDESQIDQHWLKISNGDKKILRIIPKYYVSGCSCSDWV
jgi:hypothetical protein